MPNLSPWNIFYPDQTTGLTPLAAKFSQLAQSVSDALTLVNSGTARPVATASARDALYPSGTRVQGSKVYRQDLGYVETYYTAYNASTNPGGRTPAGWYAPEFRLFGTPGYSYAPVSAPSINDSVLVQTYNTVITLNSAGFGTLPFTQAFPKAVLYAKLDNGDYAASGLAHVQIVSTALDAINFQVFDAHGNAVGGGGFRVSAIVFGC